MSGIRKKKEKISNEKSVVSHGMSTGGKIGAGEGHEGKKNHEEVQIEMDQNSEEMKV